MKRTRGGRFQKFGFFLRWGWKKDTRTDGFISKEEKSGLKKAFYDFLDELSSLCRKKNRKEEEKKYEIMK